MGYPGRGLRSQCFQHFLLRSPARIVKKRWAGAEKAGPGAKQAPRTVHVRGMKSTDDISVSHIDSVDDGRYEKVTNTVDGTLATRVRKRLGAPDYAHVTITEERIQSGTDWTQEFETTFEVAAGGKSVEFIPDASQMSTWLEEAERPERIRDTVFARFTAWRRAGDDAEALADEWFEPYEVCNWWESWLVKRGTPLHNAVTSRAGGYRQVERVKLSRIPSIAAEDHRDRTQLGETNWAAWRLDAIAPANDDGFRAIRFRRHYAVGEFDEHGGRISPLALLEITDELMPGRRS